MTHKDKEKQKEQAAEYYIQHKEEANRRDAAYYQQNKEELSERHRKWKTENKEKIAAHAAGYYRSRRDENAEYRMAHKEEIYTKERKKHLEKKYGLSVDDYNKLVNLQNNNCAICDIEMEKPYIDHDHLTNKVRGLLCSHCNFLLGFAKDSTAILVGAIKYLETNYEKESIHTQ